MPASIFECFLFAQANAPAPAAGGGSSGQFNIMAIILVAVLWFYILILRPQQKQDKQRKAMMDALKKNDRVLTSAGIYGTVVSVDAEQDKVVVRIDDDRGVRVVFTRASIIKIFDGSEDKAKDKDKDRNSKEKATETA
jgi:preprotein translocase subunit YajC